MTTATAPQSPGAERPQESTGPAQNAGCSKCEYSGVIQADAWCPQCGYYPKLGRCVDLGAHAVPEPEKPIEPIEIPAWVWIMLAGSIGIVAVSLGARFNVPEDGPLLLWSLAQFVIGLVVFLVGHVQAFLKASFKLSDFGPTDMIMRPWKLWSPTFKALPEGNGRVRLAAWGITTVLCAVFVVGGLSREQVDELIVMYLPEPEKPVTPVAQVQRMAGQSNAASLEEAVDELAGTATQFIEGPMIEEKPEMTCCVIGYTRSVNGDLRSLLLADLQHGLPHRYVGKFLIQDIDESVLTHVEAMIPKLGVDRGSIPCPIRAYWLEPKILCLVEYDEQNEDRLLVGAKVVSIEALDEGAEAVADEDRDASSKDNDDPSTDDGTQATSSSSSSSSSSS